MAAGAGASAGKKAISDILLLGSCVPCLRDKTAKVLVKKLKFDENLNMYFKNTEFFFAYDPNKISRTGDIVLIKQLPAKKAFNVSHELLRILYPLGDITDPITGHKCVGKMYRYEVDFFNELWGKSKTGFKYDENWKRGSQEDRRDFSRQETYIKYHEFEDDDQPYSF